jgi:hypothetical protein
MTEEQVEQRLEELDAPYSPDQVELIMQLLNAQWAQIDLAIWNFQEFEAHKLSSGYAAISHLWKAIRDRRFDGQAKQPKIVYVAHAIGGDVEANLTDLRRIVLSMNMLPGIVPFVPYYADVVSIGESPAMRQRGIENDTAVLKSGIVDELWLTGERLSPGMAAEMELARQLGIPVIDKLSAL